MVELNSTQMAMYELEQYSGSDSTELITELITDLITDLIVAGEVDKGVLAHCMEQFLSENDIFKMKINQQDNKVFWVYDEKINLFDQYEIVEFHG